MYNVLWTKKVKQPIVEQMTLGNKTVQNRTSYDKTLLAVNLTWNRSFPNILCTNKNSEIRLTGIDLPTSRPRVTSHLPLKSEPYGCSWLCHISQLGWNAPHVSSQSVVAYRLVQHVCVSVVSVIVKCPVLPLCAVDGCSRNPLYYYYYRLHKVPSPNANPFFSLSPTESTTKFKTSTPKKLTIGSFFFTAASHRGTIY